MGNKIITGHTKGIGKYLYDNLPCDIGFSRATGHDINNQTVRNSIANTPADLIINNAHGRAYSQTELLKSLFEAHRDDPNVLIVNIGTDIAYASKWSVVYDDYPIEKSALVAACEHYQNLAHRCRITLIEPNDVRDFGYEPILQAVQYVLTNTAVEIKNVRLHGR
jgi:hypothetical protein